MKNFIQPILVIMGPTGSGKSSAALDAAEKFDGEIVTADSMQLYRELNIGTAKPTPEERKRIPHHLIDILDISERSDLFTYRALAEKAIEDIRSRGKIPILCGGTGLYLRAVLYGLDNMPADRALRERLDAEFDSEAGGEKLRAIMREKSPSDFELRHNHRRKLIRAYEVFLLTGKSITELQKTWPKAKQRDDAVSFVLDWDREMLKKRIADRCGVMLRSGWIEETRHLAARGLFETPTAWQVLGYPIIGKFLRGELPRSELADTIVTATWQYARRQRTWFGGQHPEAEKIVLPEQSEHIQDIFEHKLDTWNKNHRVEPEKG